jgi:hypothetical protein
MSSYFENTGAICGNKEGMANISRSNLDESLPNLPVVSKPGKIADMICIARAFAQQKAPMPYPHQGQLFACYQQVRFSDPVVPMRRPSG